MNIGNNDALYNIEMAYKDVTTTGTFGTSVLQPEFFNQYVRDATRDKTILMDARLSKMNAHKQKISRTGFGGRVMEEAAEGIAGNAKNPSFHDETLTAKEYIVVGSITDQSVRRSIEKEQYRQTFVSQLSEKGGEDWETLAVFGDTTKTFSGENTLLNSQDGWVKKGTNKLYGGTSGDTQDFDPDGYAMSMMKAMLAAYPKNYLKNRSNLVFYLNSDDFDKYIEEKGERPTAAGDEAIENNIAKKYKGVQVKEAPVLNDTEATNSTTGWGNVSMLVDPSNLVYGIFHEVTLEPEREAKLRRTDYIITQETDQNYENPNVCSIALHDVDKPAE